MSSKYVRFSLRLQTFQIDWKVSRLSGNFGVCLKSFRIKLIFSKIRKLSGLSENFPECLESFSDYLESFPDFLESFQFIWKVYSFSGNFLETFWINLKVCSEYRSILDCRKTFQIFWKLSRIVWKFTIYLKTFQII